MNKGRDDARLNAQGAFYANSRQNKRPARCNLRGKQGGARPCTPATISAALGNYAKSLALRHLPCQCTLADLGCGRGPNLLKFGIGAVNAYFVLLMDNDSEMIAELKNRISVISPSFRYQIECRDFTTAFPPCITQQFDAMLVFFSLQYTGSSIEKCRGFFDNCKRSLAPQGEVIGIMPNLERLLALRANPLPDDVFSIDMTDEEAAIPRSGIPYRLSLRGPRTTTFEEHTLSLSDLAAGAAPHFVLRQAMPLDRFIEHSEATDPIAALNLKRRIMRGMTEPYPTSSWRLVGLYDIVWLNRAGLIASY
jgi:SAM-dependent methyltransferase